MQHWFELEPQKVILDFSFNWDTLLGQTLTFVKCAFVPLFKDFLKFIGFCVVTLKGHRSQHANIIKQVNKKENVQVIFLLPVINKRIKCSIMSNRNQGLKNSLGGSSQIISNNKSHNMKRDNIYTQRSGLNKNVKKSTELFTFL